MDQRIWATPEKNPVAEYLDEKKPAKIYPPNKNKDITDYFKKKCPFKCYRGQKTKKTGFPYIGVMANPQLTATRLEELREEFNRAFPNSWDIDEEKWNEIHQKLISKDEEAQLWAKKMMRLKKQFNCPKRQKFYYSCIAKKK